MVQACFRQSRTQIFFRRPTMVADLFYPTPSQNPRSAPGMWKNYAVITLSNVYQSLRILCYCTPTAESCVLFLQNHSSSLPLSLSHTLRKYQKASEFLFFQEKQKGIIDLKWFTFNIFLFHLAYSADQEFFRFPINSVDSLLTHLGTASLSDFASNLK